MLQLSHITPHNKNTEKRRRMWKMELNQKTTTTNVNGQYRQQSTHSTYTCEINAKPPKRLSSWFLILVFTAEVEWTLSISATGERQEEKKGLNKSSTKCMCGNRVAIYVCLIKMRHTIPLCKRHAKKTKRANGLSLKVKKA